MPSAHGEFPARRKPCSIASKRFESMAQKLRLAVLLSGSGTNLQALLDRSASGTLKAQVAVVVSDRPGAHGLKRAELANIPTRIIDYRALMEKGRDEWERLQLPVDLRELDEAQQILHFPDVSKRLGRLAGMVLAEDEMIRHLNAFQPDCIVLAGFMRLLSPYFLRHYNRDGAWRVLNIHPSLLPAFPGQRGYEDTFDYGVKWGGVTVHFADEGEDTGPILAQAVYPVWPDEDLDSLRKRGLQLEYALYAQCINWLASGQVRFFESSHGRTIVKIIDPNYPRILKDWAISAFSGKT